MSPTDDSDEGRDLVVDAEPLPDLGWHSSKAAQRYLGINPRTLYALVNRGELVAYRMGRVLRFQRSDLEAFVQASRVQPGSLAHLLPGGEPKRPRKRRPRS